MRPSEADDPTAGPPVFPYGSAAAFRTALRDRFAAIAKADTRYSLDELQRQFAYDRALARLFTAPDADSWVLKGAGALLARLKQARHRTLGFKVTALQLPADPNPGFHSGVQRERQGQPCVRV